MDIVHNYKQHVLTILGDKWIIPILFVLCTYFDSVIYYSFEFFTELRYNWESRVRGWNNLNFDKIF